MTINSEKLETLWLKRYGNNAWAKDCYGYWINFFDHGQNCRPRRTPDGRIEDCGWEIDHIMPESRGGSDQPTNLEFVFHECNATKSDKLRYELANGKVYSVIKRTYKSGYGIFSHTLNRFIDWESTHSY